MHGSSQCITTTCIGHTQQTFLPHLTECFNINKPRPGEYLSSYIQTIISAMHLGYNISKTKIKT